ncbi:MAG: tRNA (adenosine(37)-N6)-threonylcarbamoyltransferase complex ATPase subunit type 1 TsaE [Armatimonadota bacterium]|nr:tRNA (adenosine(37)-N6)-threonylcarbamoyltransferase complex ATPase subunit type 1 TsaE [Armatimonadota bacterium]MDR7439250.1 tRNA (adenosine(37)-N6)-threonylcarbamoyltransferase complex ATPase subunit type 1 TsaE [Armatimonadota bacterium]MDR7563287.1 tRNA (adenosine(37)-N6)-threonylcarbamoyltransferase complex ATPase subunit type 1 TsaE [Armatimonadota bacterium]MDR7567765.1 tRNA (adenosine(37)-N6)-threonylcarbamoyltransferase complex ATPase subunit type 1 TsaE [Armatimonadota bacterium]M
MQMTTHSAEETRKLGRRLAAALRPGDVVALVGELGSGKTTLVQGVAQALEARGRVASPSFLIVHEYRGRLPIYHVDLFRLRPEDLAFLGLEELFDEGGVVLVEWAERAEHLLPPDALWIQLEIVDESTRIVRLRPRGVRSRQVAEALLEAGSPAQG